MPDKPHQPDYVLYFTIVILCAVGVVTVYSASTVMAIHAHEAPDHFAVRQLGFAIVGLGLMGLVMRIHPRSWYRMAPLAMLSNLFLLFLVLLIGHSVTGGKRWLGTQSLYIQPSELAIVATAMYLAFFFTKKVTVLHNFKQGFVPALLVILVNFGLIFIEPDMGTAMTLFGMSIVLLIASGTALKRVFSIFLGAIPVLLYLAVSGHTYRSGRISTFLHPFQDKGTQAYQLLQGWTAFSAGGWFGRGYGMSLAKTGYLPEPNTDFVFPVFVEEWGYLGAIALIITFGILIWRGFIVARHAPSRFMALLAVGLTSGITMGVLINLGAVTGLLPVTGIPLPFISYGGTDLVVNLVAMGILVGISRYTLDEEPDADQLAEVIEVDDFRAGPTKPSRLSGEQPARPRRSAEVRPLRPAASKSRRVNGSRGGTNDVSWRSRRETAATSTRKPAKASEPAGKRTTAAAPGGSWRERQQRAENFQSRAGSGKKPSTNRKSSPRKER